MDTLLKGMPVRQQIEKEIKEDIISLKDKNIFPKIATFRIGDDQGEKYYESSIIKRATELGIFVESVVLGEDTDTEIAKSALEELNKEDGIHGIIMLMPFPKNINETVLIDTLSPKKDIDAITKESYGNLFLNSQKGFKACTAEACMEIMKYYGIELKGKKITILGRSNRVGKPLFLMTLNEHATPTVCHTRTKEEDFKNAVKNADIVVLATGQTESYGEELFKEGQIIIDVGTGKGRNGKIAGDFDVSTLEDKDKTLIYTPVPGGVGTVTTALLLRNVIKAAKNIYKNSGADN